MIGHYLGKNWVPSKCIWLSVGICWSTFLIHCFSGNDILVSSDSLPVFQIEDVFAVSSSEVWITFSNDINPEWYADPTDYSIEGLDIILASPDPDNPKGMILITSAMDATTYLLKVYNLVDTNNQGLSPPSQMEFDGIGSTVASCPSILRVQSIHRNLIRVVFSSPMDLVSVETQANYDIPGLTITHVTQSSNPYAVNIYTSDQSNSTYTLHVHWLKDISGENICGNTSPSFIGSTLIDAIAPYIIQITAINNSTIELEFSETMLLSSMDDPADFTIPGLTIWSVNQVPGNPHKIRLTTSPQQAITYECTVVNVQDAAGNPIGEPNSGTFIGSLDTTQLQLAVISATALSGSSVEVIFSSALDPTTAEDPSHYSIPGLSITNATLDGINPSSVVLTTTTHTENQYTITVTNVLDKVGNPLGSNNQASFFSACILPADPVPTPLSLEICQPSTGSWWDTDWTYRRALTIDPAFINATLFNFPIMIKLQGDTFDFSTVQASGADLRFLAANDSTLLDFEIERWDTVGERGELWVRIPILDDTNPTLLYLYYGNNLAADGQNGSAVWDPNYVAVWHMQQTPDGSAGDIIDSTSYGNHGQSYGGMNAADQIETPLGLGYDMDGTNDYIDVPMSPTIQISGTSATLEAWTKIPAGGTDDDEALITKFNAGNDERYHLGVDDPSELNCRFNTTITGYDRIDTPGVPQDEWTYLSSRKTIFGFAGYVNTNLIDQINYFPIPTGNIRTNPGDQLHVGKRYNARYFEGDLDEIRISNIARSIEWIQASYYSGKNVLVALGKEESRQTPSPTFTWTGEAGHTHTLEVSTDGFVTTVFTYTGTNTSTTFGILPTLSNYSWRVRNEESCSSLNWVTQTDDITMANQIQPSALFASDLSDDAINLMWNDTTGISVDTYKIEVFTDTCGGTLLAGWAKTTAASPIPKGGGYTSGNTYYWRVTPQSSAACGDGMPSPCQSFTAP
jgi:hypothetical protein